MIDDDAYGEGKPPPEEDGVECEFSDLIGADFTLHVVTATYIATTGTWWITNPPVDLDSSGSLCIDDYSHWRRVITPAPTMNSARGT